MVGAIERKRKQRQMKTSRNNKGATQLTEFGPAVLILFMSCFFPLILLLAVGLNYGAGYTLNNLQLREAVVSKRSEAENPNGNVKKAIPQAWLTSGLGKFASIVGAPETDVSYVPGKKDSEDRQDYIVKVTTKIRPRPMLGNMPFAPNIPGLTSDAVFVYANEAVIENPDDYNE